MVCFNKLSAFALGGIIIFTILIFFVTIISLFNFFNGGVTMEEYLKNNWINLVTIFVVGCVYFGLLFLSAFFGEKKKNWSEAPRDLDCLPTVYAGHGEKYLPPSDNSSSSSGSSREGTPEPTDRFFSGSLSTGRRSRDSVPVSVSSRRGSKEITFPGTQRAPRTDTDQHSSQDFSQYPPEDSNRRTPGESVTPSSGPPRTTVSPARRRSASVSSRRGSEGTTSPRDSPGSPSDPPPFHPQDSSPKRTISEYIQEALNVPLPPSPPNSPRVSTTHSTSDSSSDSDRSVKVVENFGPPFIPPSSLPSSDDETEATTSTDRTETRPPRAIPPNDWISDQDEDMFPQNPLANAPFPWQIPGYSGHTSSNQRGRRISTGPPRFSESELRAGIGVDGAGGAGAGRKKSRKKPLVLFVCQNEYNLQRKNKLMKIIFDYLSEKYPDFEYETVDMPHEKDRNSNYQGFFPHVIPERKRYDFIIFYGCGTIKDIEKWKYEYKYFLKRRGRIMITQSSDVLLKEEIDILFRTGDYEDISNREEFKLIREQALKTFVVGNSKPVFVVFELSDARCFEALVGDDSYYDDSDDSDDFPGSYSRRESGRYSTGFPQMVSADRSCSAIPIPVPESPSSIKLYLNNYVSGDDETDYTKMKDMEKFSDFIFAFTANDGNSGPGRLGRGGSGSAQIGEYDVGYGLFLAKQIESGTKVSDEANRVNLEEHINIEGNGMKFEGKIKDAIKYFVEGLEKYALSKGKTKVAVPGVFTNDSRNDWYIPTDTWNGRLELEEAKRIMKEELIRVFGQPVGYAKEWEKI